jgi:hypothetical protein
MQLLRIRRDDTTVEIIFVNNAAVVANMSSLLSVARIILVIAVCNRFTWQIGVCKRCTVTLHLAPVCQASTLKCDGRWTVVSILNIDGRLICTTIWIQEVW